MKEEHRRTLIWFLGALFVFLVVLGIIYPQLEKLENSKPSKNITVNNSNSLSLINLGSMFDFSSYANLSLGELCGDLEDCISYCAENKQSCENYCITNPENELCFKVNNFVSSEIIQDYLEKNSLSEEDLLDTSLA